MLVAANDDASGDALGGRTGANADGVSTKTGKW